jgi:lysozyme family protein
VNNVADFNLAYAKTCSFEGKYANKKDDTGGETWKGIARNFHPDWSGWKIIDRFKPLCKSIDELNDTLSRSKELEVAVQSFYKQDFWGLLDKVNSQSLAEEIFDCAVNCGQGTAGKAIQEVLNVMNNRGDLWADIPEDGGIGPKTVETINKALVALKSRNNLLQKLFLARRVNYHIDISKKREANEQFMLGWAVRVVNQWP